MTAEKMTLEAAIERLCEADHDRDCVRNGLMRGRPTADGGYECFYRVAGGTRWFRVKPVDETPKCDCGLDQAAAVLREFRERGLPFYEAAMAVAGAWSDSDAGGDPRKDNTDAPLYEERLVHLFRRLTTEGE